MYLITETYSRRLALGQNTKSTKSNRVAEMVSTCFQRVCFEVLFVCKTGKIIFRNIQSYVINCIHPNLFSMNNYSLTCLRIYLGCAFYVLKLQSQILKVKELKQF